MRNRFHTRLKKSIYVVVNKGSRKMNKINGKCICALFLLLYFKVRCYNKLLSFSFCMLHQHLESTKPKWQQRFKTCNAQSKWYLDQASMVGRVCKNVRTLKLKQGSLQLSVVWVELENHRDVQHPEALISTSYRCDRVCEREHVSKCVGLWLRVVARAENKWGVLSVTFYLLW